ncbi:hypothetical protein SDC9_175086 [bioreactor metagenome]|uniref:Uncharacterized protein n=1 Tax=bioreactor metagenome TaxID=1076179 RepID=A0A645GP21_9ZZZZ
MGAAVQDIHHGQGQGVGVGAAHIGVEGKVLMLGGSLGAGQRNTQNGVCAQAALVGGAVQGDEQPVDGGLLQNAFAHQRGGNFCVHIGNRLGNALTQIAAFVPVPQLTGFKLAGGSAGGRGGTADNAVFQRYLGLYGGISPGIQNLPACYVRNFHGDPLLIRYRF